MRVVTPYKTFRAALRALDNGGRFYDLLAKARDEKIAFSEIAKVAGVFTSYSSAFLFFDLAIYQLSPREKHRLVSSFSEFQAAMYRANGPVHMRPSEVDSAGKAGNTAIVAGHIRHVKRREEFGGFIMMPMMTGSNTLPMMVPIYDQFDVYEVRDAESEGLSGTLVATSRGSRFRGETAVRLGGYLRALAFRDAARGRHKLYLETVYYTPIAGTSSTK
jgi:hypothetical protein